MQPATTPCQHDAPYPEPASTPTLPIRCACGTTIGWVIVRAGALELEISARHHGERHTTAVPLGQVRDWLTGLTNALV